MVINSASIANEKNQPGFFGNNYTVLHLAAQFANLDTLSNVKIKMILDICIAIQIFEGYLMEKVSFFAIYSTIYVAKQMKY